MRDSPNSSFVPARNRFEAALRAAGLHLLLSAAFAGGLVLVLYLLWFPAPYQDLVRAGRLPWLILLVDIVCGPVLTAIVYDRRKPRRELFTDLSVVVLLQVAALAYGIYALAQARPVVTAFEVDRFEVVIAADLRGAALSDAPMGLRSLSLSGPRLACTRAARNGDERWESISHSLAGLPPARRPGWWRPYEECREQVRERMRPLAAAYGAAEPGARETIEDAVARSGHPLESLYYVPLTRQQRLDQWSMLLDRHGAPLGHVRLDGF